MSTQLDFLVNAINEVQETNRFLDTKAGVLAAFESAMLIAVVTVIADPSTRELIESTLNRTGAWYAILLIVYSALYVIALLGHIVSTLRSIFPFESPAEHVSLGDYEPKNLFFLFQLDEQRRIQPSVSDYAAQLAALTDDDIMQEYVFEFMKLSYIRKRKSDGLASAFTYLSLLLVGLVVFGLLIGLGRLMR